MRLPQVSGVELVKRLMKFGFVVVRQRGSHMRLEKNTMTGMIKITVPAHHALKKGTLHHILKDAGVTPEEVFG